MSFFINEINLEPNHAKPLYIQLANSLAALIKRGVLKPGYQLPGTRKLAELLDLNRNTILIALEELTAEGWLIAKERKGFYVNKDLPLQKYRQLDKNLIGRYPKDTHYSFIQNFDWEIPIRHRLPLEFNDGLPDLRLAPVQELRKEYTSLLNTPSLKFLLYYADPRGDEKLRLSIAEMLKNHRGLDVNPNQIMITRGSKMGLYLLSQILITKDDTFAIENPGYKGTEGCVSNTGCRIKFIPVDEKGLDVDLLEIFLKKQPIKAIYVTSHHQYPTTVSLAPERRMRLLHLAQRHHFAIIEDDYDYEFHYKNKPILPIASADNTGSVVYIGSFSKTLFPSMRIGYVVGPESLIESMAKLRFIIDNNGDTVLERSLSRLIDNGTYYRHIRKTLNLYRDRKNHFCTILDKDFSELISYEKPEGGMVVWGKFHNNINLRDVVNQCFAQGLSMTGNACYTPEGKHLNSIRLGFASMNEKEITKACKILLKILKNIIPKGQGIVN